MTDATKDYFAQCWQSCCQLGKQTVNGNLQLAKTSPLHLYIENGKCKQIEFSTVALRYI